MQNEPGSAGNDLAQIAEELLEQTRALRRQHEELRDALAGVAPVSAPIASSNGANGANGANRAGAGEERALPDSLHAMALQMALAGETRETVKEQLQTLHIEGGDEVVDDVFARIEARRSEPRRRLFTRRSS